MTQTTKFSWKRVGLALAIIIIGLAVLYKYGRSVWHPILVRLVGEKTISDRMIEIEKSNPDLRGMNIESVHIVAIKDPGYIEVYVNHKIWRKFQLTARSGTIGPKKQSGDGQIPEGFYHIDSVNPNSSYHLSLRVSYPNNDDIDRSERLGIKDLGGDIYIHGKDASIGCLAIGDRAIEQLFYVVNKVDYSKVSIVISPIDLSEKSISDPDNRQLYDRIKIALVEYKKWI